MKGPSRRRGNELSGDGLVAGGEGLNEGPLQKEGQFLLIIADVIIHKPQ